MIKFRQKIFFAPLAALGGGSALMGAFNVGSTALGVGGMVQAHSQGKQQEEMNEQNLKAQEQQARQMEEQMKAQNKALQAIADNAAKNPHAAQQTLDIMSMKSYSNNAMRRNSKGVRLKLFGVPYKNYLSAAKEAGNILFKNYKGTFTDMALMGVGTVGGSYLVDRYIQSDKAKKNDAVVGTRAWEKQQRARQSSYSETKTKEISGSGVLKKYGGSVLGGAAFSVFPLISYKISEGSKKNQVNSTNTIHQETSHNPVTLGQRAYAAPASKGFFGNLSNMWGNFKKHPGQSVLGFINQLNMGGGHKKSFEVAKQFQNSNNKLVKQAGNWLQKHPKTLIAATTVPAAIAMSGGMSLGEKPTKAILKSVDRDAFAYERSQEQLVN